MMRAPAAGGLVKRRRQRPTTVPTSRTHARLNGVTCTRVQRRGDGFSPDSSSAWDGLAAQMGTTLLRLKSSTFTAGTGNPLVTTGELAGALVLALLGLLAPLIAAVLVVILLVVLARRAVRRRASRRAGVAPR